MGLTQHVHAVMTIQEIVNVLLLQGNIGKDGAGPCPVRGHSNVQGDRTMGIWEQMPQTFLDALGAEFGFTPPTEHGVDATATVQRLRDKSVRVFFGMGGNFAMATPDTPVVHEGLRACDLTVHVSTKLNRSHTVTGTRGADPALPGPHRPRRHPAGRPGRHRRGLPGAGAPSRGRLEPPSEHCRSEVAIVAGLAERIVPGVGDHRLAAPWRRTTTSSASTSPAWSRTSRTTTTGSASPAASCSPTSRATCASSTPPAARPSSSPGRVPLLEVPEGRLLLQTIRSHDQFNTTIYGHADRYRGISGNRRVVLVNPDDLHRLGFHAGPGRRRGQRVRGHRPPGRGLHAWCPTPPPRAAPRPTTRRPTC